MNENIYRPSPTAISAVLSTLDKSSDVMRRKENFMPDELRTQLTLVTHYGEKSESLSNLIIMLQGKLSESFGFAFKPYDLNQVHGTIVGFEGDIPNPLIINQWNNEIECPREVDSSLLLQFIRSDKIMDIELKVGGWQRHNSDYGFYSKGEHPFIRSFSIQGEIAVTMGWPYRNGHYSEELYKLRKNFEEINILHKWNKDGYKDNDFFFVLGRVSREHLSPSVVQRAASEVRTILSGVDERVRIGKDTMSIVAYIDPQLPLTTSKAFRIEDPELTPDLINQLYRPHITVN